MKCYEINNKSADKAEVWIYDAIGEDFWTGGGTTAKSFQKELSAIKAKQIDLHINSPGGSVQDGIGIYNSIKQHPANVTTYIDGWACSIASVIALAGDQVFMAENGIFMVHNPMGREQGYAKDLRNVADILDKICGTMLTTYARKTNKSEDEIKLLLDGDTGDGTWMTAFEARDFGFVDEVAEEMDLAACARFLPVISAAGFKSIPAGLVQAKKKIPDNPRAIERILRDGGCSEKMAKAILAEGYKEPRRDVDAPVEDVGDQRDVAPTAPVVKAKDRVADLLTRAEVVAPSKTKTDIGGIGA